MFINYGERTDTYGMVLELEDVSEETLTFECTDGSKIVEFDLSMAAENEVNAYLIKDNNDVEKNFPVSEF